MIHQPNAGLGAARNEGVRRSTGAYLAFADSDDLVVDGAYAALVGSLERTGSDLAIGAVERLRDDERFMTPLMRENHQQPRLGREHRRGAADAGRRLRVEQGLPPVVLGRRRPRLPGCVRYEDQPAMTRALSRRRFDVLARPGVPRRVRSDGSSISQQRADLRDLSDRILTKRWSMDTVLASISGPDPSVVRPGAADRHVGVLPGGPRLLRRVLGRCSAPGRRSSGTRTRCRSSGRRCRPGSG